jgi:hypothetical protein
MLFSVLISTIRLCVAVVVGGAALAFLWSCMTGGRIANGDGAEPFLVQRVSAGKGYVVRWQTWIGASATMLLAPATWLIL